MPVRRRCGSRARVRVFAIVGLLAACGGSSGQGAQSDSSSGFDDGSSAEASDPSAPDDDGAVSTSGADDVADTDEDEADVTGTDTDAEPSGDELPYDPDQLERVCERGNGDPIAQALCSEPTPAITDLVGLHHTLGMTPAPAYMSLLASSTSIAGRSISVINPRTFVYKPFQYGIAAAAFSRGEQFVELVGYDEAADALNFYLLTFFRDCNDAEGGCTLAESFTPAIESEWTKWSLYQDVDLENHTLDCLTCHQPNGPGAEKLLIGQESTEPWLHWFPGVGINYPGLTGSGAVLTPRFIEMHGDEARFGGVVVDIFTPPNPAASGITLQNLLEAYWSLKDGVPLGHTPDGQPYGFDSVAVEADIAMGSTTTWDGYFAQTLTGERLPVPFHSFDTTDPDLRAAAVASYLDVTAGIAPPESLVDPRTVLTAQTEVELGFRPRPGASAQEILHHVCQRCHNDELDQTLSRAKFNAERPEEIPADEKAVAIERLTEPDDPKLQMPPPRFATLPAAEKQTLIEFLQE